MAWHPFRNIGLKIAALCLGTLLWVTVSGHQVERRFSVPLSFRNVPVPLELTGEQVERVSVHVRGDDNIVSTLTEGALRVNVDLATSQAGANIVPLRTDQVVAPPGVEVMQVDPGTVTVSLERAAQRAVPVRPTIDGQPAPGHAISAIAIEPSTVQVAGPESRLAGAVSVITERVLLDGRTNRFVQDVGVGVADSQLRVVGPHAVRVTVTIVPVGGGTREGEAPPVSEER
jgi:YbbR domain-containing protein